MPNIEFSDEELTALAAAARKVLDEDRYPLSPRLGPLKSALATLDPSRVRKTRIERPPLPEAPARGRGSRRTRG